MTTTEIAETKASTDTITVRLGRNHLSGRTQWGIRLAPDLKPIFGNSPVTIPRFHDFEVLVPLAGTPQEKRPVVKRLDVLQALKPHIDSGKLQIIG